jgi:O-antigen ligase
VNATQCGHHGIASYRNLHWVLGVPLVLLPVLLGGARPWISSTVAAIFCLGLVALVWLDSSPGSSWSPAPVGIWRLAIAAIVGYGFLQALPMPKSWLQLLDPHRVAWIQTAETAIGRAIPAAAISYVPLATVMQALFWIFLTAYGLLLWRTIQEERRLDWLWRLLFVMVGLEAFYGLVQVLIPDLGVVFSNLSGNPYGGMARGTFVNKNHYAAFLGMIWPVLLARILTLGESAYGPSGNAKPSTYPKKEEQQQLRHKQMLLSFIVGLALLALLFSQSRGGALSAVVALTVFVVLAGTHRKSVLVLVAGIWFVILGYGSIVGFDEVLTRFDRTEQDAPGRFKLWADTKDMVCDHPWTGVGLGGYGTVFRLYQEHQFVHENMRASHAHNDYAQFTAELGVPAAGLLFLLVWGYWWKTAWRLRRRDAGKPAGRRGRAAGQRLIAVGALAGSASFLCHCWVDFNWQIPANQLYFLTLLVLMSLETERELNCSREASRPAKKQGP